MVFLRNHKLLFAAGLILCVELGTLYLYYKETIYFRKTIEHIIQNN